MESLSTRYGDWALVVWATSGIGRALVERIAADGMNIVAVARTQETLDRLAREVHSTHGVEVVTVSADLSAAEGVTTVIDAVGLREIGLLIPCAALESSGYFVNSSAEFEQRMLQMNCVAPMLLAHHFGGSMAQRRRGAILLVSSLSGWMSQPYMAGYGASKAYILSLGESLHSEMKDVNVDVAVLSPGPTDTPMAAGTGIDFAKMGMTMMSPTDVAAAGLAALGRRANAIPGARNKVMAVSMTHLMPRSAVSAMFRRMLGKALDVASTVPQDLSTTARG